MATSRMVSTDMRRQVGTSPRPKGRENKDTPCRNITIYGHCRYINTCTFNHDQEENGGRKIQTLSGDSPSFTPASLQNQQTTQNTLNTIPQNTQNTIPPTAPQGPKKSTLTVKAASAAPFTPRAAASTLAVQEEPPAPFNPAAIREFTPSYDIQTTQAPEVHFDYMPTTPYNPYDDQANMNHAPYFPAPASYAAEGQPLQYHLYYPTGTRRVDLLPHQRLAHDFFIPEKLREELHRKAEASRQILNSGLPPVDNYHSLVALDTSNRKAHNVLGYPSWVYKATSSKNGHMYCLRRLEGFRLSTEETIRCVKTWKRLNHANITTIWDAFTTRAFGDSSLIFVMDYHPLSKTLAEFHNLTTIQSATPTYRQSKQTISETTLWAYITQLAGAIKAIHDQGLAARCIDATKIIVSDKNRVRFNACSILDVVHFDARRPIAELQQEDLVAFGRLVLHLATDTPLTPYSNLQPAVDALARFYSKEICDTVAFLIEPPTPAPNCLTIDDFVRGIALRSAATLDEALQSHDSLRDNLSRELENGRVARLLMKFCTIMERDSYEGDRIWSESGERYVLKLFRDYVFHQVDAQGSPVVDVAHMLRCINKLDAGSDEQVCLTSRDENTCIVVSYKEIKKHLAASFGDLCKGSRRR